MLFQCLSTNTEQIDYVLKIVFKLWPRRWLEGLDIKDPLIDFFNNDILDINF